MKSSVEVYSTLFLLQLDMTFHLFVCALAGAGAAVIAMVSIGKSALYL